MKLALIGRGKWGVNIEKVLESFKQVELIVANTPKQTDKLMREELDGVLVATPGSTHVEVALPFIKQGLAVFIEKPMAISLTGAKQLEKEANKSGAEIMVGHVHLYNPAWQAAKREVKKLGKLDMIYCEGMNNGPVREDMSALWDWAPHDVACLLDLLGETPSHVQAWGDRNWAKTKLEFEDVTAVLNVSWAFPEKRKRISFIGEKGMAVYDDVNPKKQYKKSPLEEEMRAFIKMVKMGEEPVSDLEQGMAVTKILAAAERSMKFDGKTVKI